MPKLKLTRPDFLAKFMSGDINEDDMRQILPEHHMDMYCCYDLLRPFDFANESIISASYDSENRIFCIHMESSKYPKKIKEKWHKQTIKEIDAEYLIKVKARDKFVYIELIALDDDEE